MRSPPRQRGAHAEDLACAFLRARGLGLLARNYHCRRGEIDLVMSAGDTLVFVEVRYRAREDFGSGAESVDARKRARLIAAAGHYLQRHTGAGARACRFDVVSITGPIGRERIDWIEHAFET